ncbi:MAG: NADH-quinone oxidoreductase subunit L, partial [Tepidisphaeraceae bacterium]
RMGEPLAGYVGTAFSSAGFAAAVGAMVVWIYGGNGWGFQQGPWVETLRWLPIGNFPGQRDPGFLDVSLYVDSLTIVMLAMVTLVSTVVHLFSIGYMRDDARYACFFRYLSFFVFSMCGLLLAGTLLHLLVFWELVGLSSYLLIGFWHDRPAARTAAIKAFVTNRVGDVGFIIGMALIVAHVGNTTLADLWRLLDASTQTAMSPALLSVVGGLLFCGAIGKSAQFPLHTWLPDAMAGPTPVSALIHAATMVAAGVYLLARISPILTPDAHLFITVIGAVTIAIGTLCALAQRDLKRVLAFSTMAQLGYMVLAIGVGSWVGASFHLLTHAFFKGLLFLGAGMVIHAMHHETRFEKFGGLYKRLPVTAVTFAIGGLAMSGAPYLSGFYSKEMILAHAAAWTTLASTGGRGVFFQLVLWVPVLGAYITPIYLARAWMLTFAGKPRDRELFHHANEPGVMSFPLVLLAGMTIVAGYSWFPIQSMVESAAVETQHNVQATAPQINPMNATWPTLSSPTEVLFDARDGIDVKQAERSPIERQVQAGYERAAMLTKWSWLIGTLIGIVAYARGFALTDRMARFAPFREIRLWLRNRMFFDDLYDFVFVGSVELLSSLWIAIDARLLDPCIDGLTRATVALSRGVAWTDDRVVDGAVRGVAAIAWQGGRALRSSQGGRVRVDVACAIGAIAILSGGLVGALCF